MKINKKAGYEITRKPFEPTSLFGDGNTPEGDVSDCTVDFETGDTDQLESGDTLSTLFGKIKFFINSVVNKFLPLGGTTGQVLKKASDENYDVEWADEEGGSGLPTGGTTGQVLKKASDDNYDVEWGDESGGSSLPSGGKSGDVLTKTGAGDDAVAWKEQFPQITFGDEKNIIVTGKSPINNTYRLWYWDEEEEVDIEVPVTLSNFRYDATEHKIKFTMGNPSENNYNYSLYMSLYRLLVNRIYDSSEEAYVPIEGTAVSPITSVETDVIDGNYVGGFQQAFVGVSFGFNLELQAGATIDMEIPITGINNLVDTENKVSVITQGVMPSPNNSSNKLYLASYYGYAFWSTVEQGSQLPTQGDKGYVLTKDDNSWSSNACSWKKLETATPYTSLFLNNDRVTNVVEINKAELIYAPLKLVTVSSNSSDGYIDYTLTTKDGTTSMGDIESQKMLVKTSIYGMYPDSKLTCAKVSGDSGIDVQSFEIVDDDYIQISFVITNPGVDTERTFTIRFSDVNTVSGSPCWCDFASIVSSGMYLFIQKTFIYTEPYPKYANYQYKNNTVYGLIGKYPMSNYMIQPVISVDDANHEITISATNNGDYNVGFNGYLPITGWVGDIVSNSNPDFSVNMDYSYGNKYLYIDVFVQPSETVTTVVEYTGNIDSIDTSNNWSFDNLFCKIDNNIYGIPDGGSTGQILMKNSDDDGDVYWGSNEVNFEKIFPRVDLFRTLTTNRCIGKIYRALISQYFSAFNVQVDNTNKLVTFTFTPYNSDMEVLFKFNGYITGYSIDNPPASGLTVDDYKLEGYIGFKTNSSYITPGVSTTFSIRYTGSMLEVYDDFYYWFDFPNVLQPQ